MYTMTQNQISPYTLLVGPAVGLMGFSVGLATLEGVLFRPDHQNIYRFNLDTLMDYIKLPFNRHKYQIAWGLLPGISLGSRFKLWNLNWVIMVGSGTIGSLLYYYLRTHHS